MKNKTTSYIAAIIFTIFTLLFLSTTVSASSASSVDVITSVYTSVLDVVSMLTAVSVVVMSLGVVYLSFHRYVGWIRSLYDATNTIHHR